MTKPPHVLTEIYIVQMTLSHILKSGFLKQLGSLSVTKLNHHMERRILILVRPRPPTGIGIAILQRQARWTTAKAD
jgi:hypothetical protein